MNNINKFAFLTVVITVILWFVPFVAIISVNQLFSTNVEHTILNYLSVWGLIFVAKMVVNVNQT